MTAREQFEALYREHGDAVLSYARRRTSLGNAEDVVAEVFLTAWRRLEDVPADARVWLLVVARRTLANQRRGDTRRAALQDRLAAEPLRDSEPGGGGGSDDRVLRALSSLSEKDREVLLLLGWEELSHRDAASVLGIRAGTLAVRLHRARTHFARALESARIARPTIEASQTPEAP